MKKYTFIVEFKGGTYISQHKSTNLTEALFIWANTLDPNFFTNKIKNQILEKVNDPDNIPTPIISVENVWSSSYVIARSLLLLNIIETV